VVIDHLTRGRPSLFLDGTISEHFDSNGPNSLHWSHGGRTSFPDGVDDSYMFKIAGSLVETLVAGAAGADRLRPDRSDPVLGVPEGSADPGDR
jgi:hypothetical protein